MTGFQSDMDSVPMCALALSDTAASAVLVSLSAVCRVRTPLVTRKYKVTCDAFPVR